jgi:hypothetical protein
VVVEEVLLPQAHQLPMVVQVEPVVQEVAVAQVILVVVQTVDKEQEDC